MKNVGMMLALMLFGASACQAASNAGTTGAQFLKLGAGARSTAMGDAFVGIADDSNALAFNPAGIAFASRPEMSATHTQWLQGLDYNLGDFVFPTNYGAFGFSAATLKVDSLGRRGTDESDLGTFSAIDQAYALSFAKDFGHQFSLGATGRYISQRIDSASAATWSGDIGALKNLGDSPFSLGLAIRQIGKPVQFQHESDPLPLVTDAGVGMHFLRDRLLIGTDVKFSRDTKTQYGAGLEWKQSLGSSSSFALRGGYNSSVNSNGSGLTMGGGLTFRSLALNFAWVPFGDLGNTFRYSVGFRF